MRIAIKYDRDVLISSDDGHACDTGKGYCEGSSRLCNLNLCSKQGGKPLERYLGPHMWHSVGTCEEKDPVEVLVLEDNRIYRAEKRKDNNCDECDWYEGPKCTAYCAGKGSGALCNLLGRFFGVEQVIFKEVK